MARRRLGGAHAGRGRARYRSGAQEGGRVLKILAVDISSVFRRAWEAGHDDAYSVARSRAVSKILDAASGFDRIVIARDPPEP